MITGICLVLVGFLCFGLGLLALVCFIVLLPIFLAICLFVWLASIIKNWFEER